MATEKAQTFGYPNMERSFEGGFCCISLTNLSNLGTALGENVVLRCLKILSSLSHQFSTPRHVPSKKSTLEISEDKQVLAHWVFSLSHRKTGMLVMYIDVNRILHF